jgi:hypothetical protein
MKNIQKSKTCISEYAKRHIEISVSYFFMKYIKQNLIVLLCFFLTGILLSCSEEKLEPIIDPPITGPVNNITPVEDYRTVRSFETGKLNDWKNGTIPENWHYFFISGFGEPDEYLNTTTLSGESGKLIFSNDVFSLDGFEENDLLKIRWKVKLKSIELSEAYFPMITVGLKEGKFPVDYGNWMEIKEVGGDWIEFTEYFRIKRPGVYQLFFACDLKSTVNQMTIRWKDFTCEQVRKQIATP